MAVYQSPRRETHTVWPTTHRPSRRLTNVSHQRGVRSRAVCGRVKAIGASSGDSRLRRVGFFAIEDIAEGTELCYTRDRNAISAKQRNKNIPCLCGAPICAGFV